jgi:OOP family OmpA-OmpF porin
MGEAQPRNLCKLIALLAICAGLSACSTMRSVLDNQAGCIAANSIAGAGLGASVEAVVDSDNLGRGAAIGGGMGALLGLAVCGPRDSDADGVADSSDKCPSTPRNIGVDKNGCPVDSDGDKVTDDADRCMKTPPGTIVSPDGCPLNPDTDSDGVADDVDKCPDTPRDSKVDEKGCPEVGQTLSVLEGVNFKSGEASLLPEAKGKLNRIAKTMKQQPDMQVRIEGHTDSTDANTRNLRLSQQRAQAVARYLIGRGIAKARLEPMGRGEESPKASNDTAEGRYQNRRVEFIVTGK